jgi:hypothetical protein
MHSHGTSSGASLSDIEAVHASQVQSDARFVRVARPRRVARDPRTGEAANRWRRSQGIPRAASALAFSGFIRSTDGERTARQKMDGRAAYGQLQDPPRQTRNQAAPGFLLLAGDRLISKNAHPANGSEHNRARPLGAVSIDGRSVARRWPKSATPGHVTHSDRPCRCGRLGVPGQNDTRRAT